MMIYLFKTNKITPFLQYDKNITIYLYVTDVQCHIYEDDWYWL